MKCLAATLAVTLVTTLASASALASPAACPKAGEQLPELLASAMQQVGWEGEVRAEFDVDAQGRVKPVKVDGHRQYEARVRSALYSLDCHGGTPQRYIVSIRFADPVKLIAAAKAASAPVVAVSSPR